MYRMYREEKLIKISYLSNKKKQALADASVSKVRVPRKSAIFAARPLLRH
jgi:hypothetical protein